MKHFHKVLKSGRYFVIPLQLCCKYLLDFQNRTLSTDPNWEAFLRLGTALAQGFSLESANHEGLLKEAVSAARQAKAAVIFAGLPETWKSEGQDR